MNLTLNKITKLDLAISTEVRAELARQKGKSVSGFARALGYRRPTISDRINGHQPFTPGLLEAAAEYLDIDSQEIYQRAKRSIEESD